MRDGVIDGCITGLGGKENPLASFLFCPVVGVEVNTACMKIVPKILDSKTWAKGICDYTIDAIQPNV